MKKKITAFLIACAMCMTSFYFGEVNVQAEEPQCQDIDYSYLTDANALIGYADMQTWGVYLAQGTSSITKISSNTIGAGGSTLAAMKCSVAITCIVERYVNGVWLRVTSWNQTRENAAAVMTSKSLVVATNNIYRVRSSHYAESDYSSSYTNNLHM